MSIRKISGDSGGGIGNGGTLTVHTVTFTGRGETSLESIIWQLGPIFSVDKYSDSF